ncbi:Aste57867_819 [Aphanomyces stellatus]|uniref:Aste57867_819 protein n=1 Tax=Aphanomyces stellatus TaxID=120398 RepID=A0A485K3Y5_9STRA|nr:hypothetical protein As57867_000818 [Aphanomyces stellatus]VFT78043.1 Aste57867_819 [Aphanomyces stellatus]
MEKKLTRKAKKRAYLREFMQGYRQKVKNATQSLKDQVRHLEVECKRRSFTTLMPWHEVADALRLERSETETEYHALKKKLREVEAVAYTMQQWVLAQSPVPRSPDAVTASWTWRNVTLMADPATRTLGKEWILQQMYFNTDRMFHHHGFPPIESMESMYEMEIQFKDDCIYYHAKRQMETFPPDAIVRRMYRDRLCSILMTDGYNLVSVPTIVETTETTTLHQMTTRRGEWINVLVGEFNCDARCVIVAQQIQTDEVLGKAGAKGSRQRSRMMWCVTYDFQRLASGRWMYRTLYLNSQSFLHRDGTYVPLDVEAEDIGLSPINMGTEHGFRREGEGRIMDLYECSAKVWRDIYIEGMMAAQQQESPDAAT